MKDFESRFVKIGSFLLVIGLLKVLDEESSSLPYFLSHPVFVLTANTPMEILGYLAWIFSPAFAFAGISYSQGFYKNEKRYPLKTYLLSLGLLIPSFYFVMNLLSVR